MASIESSLKIIFDKQYRKPAGQLLIFGQTDFDAPRGKNAGRNIIRKKDPKLYRPHCFTDLKVQSVVSSCTSTHSAIITEDNQVYMLGKNSSGQLGLNDTEPRNFPCHVKELKNHKIVSAACGRRHTLFLTDRGEVFACGDNRCGQCGTKKSLPQLNVPRLIDYSGPPIIKIDCGGEFSMILDMEGKMYAFGSPEYGQLGNDTDGQHLVTSKKIELDYVSGPLQITKFVQKTKKNGTERLIPKGIVDFACGANHTVAIDADNRVFSWGFGGYGRLGHAEPKDEKVPRLIQLFETRNAKIRAVYCGNTFSFANLEIEGLYMFGQQKMQAEANMYPKLVQDLNGWNVKLVACGNTSVILTADDSVISWGPSPCYGELGHGENTKSSSIPKEIHFLKGLEVTSLTMGYSHSLVVARNDTDEFRNILKKFPVHEPEKFDDVVKN